MTQRTVNFSDKSLFNPAFKINNVNVALLGQLNSMLQASGVNIGMGGQDDLGKRITIMEQDAADWTLAANGTLFGGIYQAVQVDSAATAANVGVGKAAFIKETATGGAAGSGAQGYVVTDESHADATSLMAGIFLNSITPGNFGFIQVHGKVNLLFRAVLSQAGAVGGLVLLAGLGTGVFDTIVAPGAFPAGAITSSNYGLVVGLQLAAAANAGTSAVHLTRLFGRY